MITISDTGHTLNNRISFYAPSRESKSTPVYGKSFVTFLHPLLHTRSRASESYRTLVHSLWLDFHSRPSSHGSGERGDRRIKFVGDFIYFLDNLDCEISSYDRA